MKHLYTFTIKLPRRKTGFDQRNLTNHLAAMYPSPWIVKVPRSGVVELYGEAHDNQYVAGRAQRFVDYAMQHFPALEFACEKVSAD